MSRSKNSASNTQKNEFTELVELFHASLPQSLSIQMRPAEAKDIAPVTQFIHRIFRYWMDQGYCVPSAVQNKNTTRAHLVGKGFVIEAPTLIATFSVDICRIAKKSQQQIQCTIGNNVIREFKLVSADFDLYEQSLFYINRIAVSPERSRNNLGNRILNSTEEFAKKKGYPGLALYTSIEFDFVYRWYLRNGYELVGQASIEGSGTSIVVMVKKF